VKSSIWHSQRGSGGVLTLYAVCQHNRDAATVGAKIRQREKKKKKKNAVDEERSSQHGCSM